MLNKVILIGNVGADPEIRTLDSGTKVASLRVATNEYYKDNKHTEWHSVVAWRGLADVVEKYVKKGTLLYVEGRIRRRDYEDKDGNKRYSFEIVADVIRMLGRGEISNVEKTETNSAEPSSDTFIDGGNDTKNNIPPAEEEDDLPF